MEIQNVAMWAMVDKYSLSQAACLVCNQEPDSVAFGDPVYGIVSVIESQLADSGYSTTESIGHIQNTDWRGFPTGTSRSLGDKKTITRERLKAWCESMGHRPKVFFADESTQQKDISNGAGDRPVTGAGQDAPVGIGPKAKKGGIFEIKATIPSPKAGFVYSVFPRNKEEWRATAKDVERQYKHYDALFDGREPKSKKSKTPSSFIEEFKILLANINRRAEYAKLEFDKDAMPGLKEDLFELAKRYGRKHGKKDFDIKLGTFDDYITGLCRFTKKKDRTDFYRRLYPELFP